mmetsp:Transcript_29934/g.95657  ORF Transcript_29934/g.95657 Transcript_29934/m.95657 type:complete len:420 (-) Transcript_29934:2457-3716(-)
MADSGASLEEQLAAARAELQAKDERIQQLEGRVSTLTKENEDLREKQGLDPEDLELLESKFMKRITDLAAQLSTSERKLQNAKFVAEACENMAARARSGQLQAEDSQRRCQDAQAGAFEQLRRETNKSMVETLREAVDKLGRKITAKSAELREGFADPDLKKSGKFLKRKQLNELKVKVEELIRQRNTQMALLQQYESQLELEDQLRTHASMGSVSEMQALINKGVSLTSIDESGYTALHYAAGRGHVQATELLLSAGATNHSTDMADPPLLMACQSGFVKVVKCLLQWGAPLNVTNMQGRNCVHLAAANGHYEVLDFLIEKGADVNHKDNHHNTALHLVASTSYVEIANLLVSAGVDAMVYNKSDQSALGISRLSDNPNPNRRMIYLIHKAMGHKVAEIDLYPRDAEQTRGIDSPHTL